MTAPELDLAVIVARQDARRVNRPEPHQATMAMRDVDALVAALTEARALLARIETLLSIRTRKVALDELRAVLARVSGAVEGASGGFQEGWQGAIEWLAEYGSDRPTALLIDDMRTRFPLPTRNKREGATKTKATCPACAGTNFGLGVLGACRFCGSDNLNDEGLDATPVAGHEQEGDL